jgi:uncharacterized repeat protein (TIGR01451 family)
LLPSIIGGCVSRLRLAAVLRLSALVLVLFAATPLFAASYTSSQSGVWSAASTWGNAGVPGSGDTATINSGYTVTLDAPVTVGTLTLVGTVTGTQSLTISSAFNWNGGTMSGAGTTTLPSGSVTTLAGYGYLDARQLSNAGTLSMTSTYYFYMQNNAAITNSGTIDFLNDGGIYVSGSTGSIAISGSGTIKKSGGTGSSTINVPLSLQSGGQFQVQTGTFAVGAVTASGSTFTVPSSTTLNFNTNDTRSFDGTSSISGAGTVQWTSGTNTVSGSYNVTGATKASATAVTLSSISSVGDLIVSGGTLTLNSGSAISVPTLTMQGGTLAGTAPITLTGSAMTWSGGTIGGSGTLSIPAGTTITVAGYPYFDGRPVTNAGTINYTSSYYSYMMNNAVLTNSGTIDFQGDGGLYMSGTVGSTALINSNIVKKSAGTGAAAINVPLTAQSGSQLLLQSGSLYLGAVTSSGASFSATVGTTLNFYYNEARTFDASSSISGAGTVQFSSGTATVGGTYNVTGATKAAGGTTTLSSITSVGNVTVSAGTLTLNSGSALTIPILTMQGGTLNGSAPISITGTAMSWTYGTLGGTAALSVPAGTTLTVSSVTLDGRAMTNAGVINLVSAGYWYFQNNATLANSGTIDFQADNNIYMNGTVGTTALTNSGTIKKTAGSTGGSTFNVPLIAQSGSQFQLQAGILYPGPITSTGAVFTVSSGATLYFYYNDTRTFDAASSLSGAGTVLFASGTTTVGGTYNVTGLTKSTGGTNTIGTSITSVGDLLVSGGTLTLNNGSTLTVSVLTMQGGTLNGSAPIALSGSAMTWSGGTIGGSGALSIPAGTTISLSGLYLDTRPLSNAGIINFTGSGYWYFQNNATLANSGVIDIQADGNIYQSGATGTTAITNTGTIKKSGGTTSGSTLNVPLVTQSGSQVLVQNGILYPGPLTSTGATFSVSSGATLYFYYSETRGFDAASTISGAGTVHFGGGTNTVSATYNITGLTKASGGTTTIGSPITSVGDLTVVGGTLTLNNASALSVPTLTMQSGILNGTAPINLTGSAMTWSGGTIGGSGALSIPAGTTVSLTGLYLDTRPLTNAGIINFTGSSYWYFQNNATLANSGTIDIQADGNLYLSGTVGTTAITNSGTIKKSAGTSGSTFSVPLIAQSGSQFPVQAGTLYLGPTASTGAAFSVSSGATLYFYYSDTRTFDAASTISGAGSVVFGGGTNTVSGTYNITGATKGAGGTSTIGTSITSVGDVTMTGGTLTLNNAAALSVPTLTMQGGILNGTAPINVSAAAMTWSSGTLGGSGAVSIPAGTTISLSYLSFDGRPVNNAGTINMIGGYAYMLNNAVLTNTNIIDFTGDGNLYLNSVLGTTAVVNSGTIKKTGGTNGTTINIPLTMQSGSQFLLQTGYVNLGAVTATAASFSLSSGTTLYFNTNDTRTFDAASTISGAGTAQWQSGTNTFSGTLTAPIGVAGGTLTINSAATQTIPTLTMSGGTLNGSAAINLTGAAMTWSGGTLGGGAALSIPAGTTITVSGVPYFDARQLSNAGTINITSYYYIYMQNNAVLTNSGMVNIQGDGAVYMSGTVGTTAVVNSGTIKKSGGTGGSTFNVPLTMQSGSQFLAQSGTVYLGAVAGTSASFNVSSGATLNFYYSDTRTFDAASSITGAGTLQVQGGTNTFAGTISTPLTMSGGTLTINNATAQTIPTLAMSGGTLNGSAAINLTGAAMTWNGGIIGGSGMLSIPAGTTITVSGVPYFDGRPISNAGTFNISSYYYIYMQNNAVLTNSGTIDIQGDGAIYMSGTVGSTAVVNSGTIKKSGGTGGSTFSVPLTAQSGSQFLVQSGLLYLGAVAATGASFNVSSGATLNFYYSDVRTFDAASTITGAGTLLVQGGTSTVSGTLSTPLSLSGGTLTINSAAAQSISTLTMAGGTLNGSAAVSLTGAAMTWSGGTIAGGGTLTITAPSTVTVNGGGFIDGRPVTNAGTLKFNSSSYLYMQNGAALTNNGTIDFQGDGNLYLNTGAATLTNNGTFGKSGGSGTSSISIPTTNAAAGTIKAASGTISFTNTLAQAGTLNFPIAGAASFGKVSVSGNFALGGTLTVGTTGGYTPANGTPFQILSFGSSSGSFANKNLDYPSGTFVENYNPTNLTMTAGPQTLFLSSVSPTSGPTTGGTSVTLAGSSFASGATVTFGGVASPSVTFNNSTSLTATTPVHAAGPVDVVVTNPSTQTSTLTNGFTFTGLVSHYSFDVAGTPGKDVADSNDATPTNVTQLSGRIGQAGSFASGFMNIPAATNLTLRGSDFTIEAFVNSSATTNGNWFTKAAAGPVHAYGLGTSGTNKAVFSFDGGAGGSATSTTAVFDGTWHHVAGVKRGSTAEIWVDGRLEASAAITGSADGGNFAVGRNGGCCETFTGMIDEAKIYNFALTQTAIRTDANTPDLSIVKSAPPSVTQGQNITYSITVSNAGPISATGVTVTDTLPAGTSIYSANASQGSCSGAGTITCSLGTIASAASATVTIVVTANTPGTVNNTATVSANETDPTPANNSSTAGTTVNALVCAAPTITPGGPTTFCAGGNVQLTASATGASAYQWYLNNLAIGSATASTYLATASGSYTVRATYPNTCAATSAATTVTVNPTPPTPTITPGGPTTFCSGGSVSLTAPAGYVYSWSNGATTRIITVTASGNYSVTVTDGNGCSAASAATTVTVTAAPTQPVITASGPTTFCSGGSVTLDAGAGYSTYAWTNGATTRTITVSASGSYGVTVGNGTSCTASAAPVTVTVNAPPPSAITAPASLCAGASSNASVPSTAGATYAWGITNGTITGGQGTSAITFTAGNAANTQIGVTVTSGGCPSNGNANVAIGSFVPSISASGPTTFCTGGSVTLTATAGSAYQWFLGATPLGSSTQQTLSVSASGSYKVQVTGAGGCSGTSAPVNVTVSAPPSVTITGPSTVCPATPVTLDAGAGFVSYAWSNGANTRTINVNLFSTTTYSVSVTDGNGCSATASKTVTVSGAGNPAITAPLSVAANSSGNTASVAPGPGGSTYAWTINNGTITAGAGTPSITWSAGAVGPITINITVTSGACTASGSASVGVTGQADVGVALAASPNPVSSGASVVFTLSPVNNGPSNASNVVVALNLPAGFTIGSASGTGWSCSAGSSSVGCTAAGVPVGPLAVITVNTMAPGTAGSYAASATISTTSSDPAPGNNSAAVTVVVQQPAPNCSTTPAALIAPAAGATVSNPVSFSWSAVAGATSYEVWVSSGGGAASIAATTTGATNASASLPSGAATWNVIARFPGDCAPVVSPQRSFTVAQAVNCGGHAAPQLTSPTANATVASPVTFQWQGVAEATGYRVFVAVDGGAPQDVGTTGAATTQLSVPLTGNSFQWSVDALFAGCPATHSAAGSFTIPKPDPCAGHVAPTLTAPANNSTTAGSTVDFHWNAVPGATSYRVFASVNGAEAAALGTTSATTLHTTITSGAVEWFVQALFDGCPSLSSPHFTFTVPAAVSCNNAAPVTIAPPSGATVNSAAVTFTWSAVPAAIGYQVWTSFNNGTAALLGAADSTSLAGTVAAGSYDWFVRALFNGCDPADSPVSHFTYAPPAACQTQHPLLTLPLDNASFSGPVDFRWSDVAAPAQYRVWISLNDAPATLLGTTTGHELNGQSVPAGVITWYVEASRANCPVLQSTVGAFRLTPPPPPCTPPDAPSPRGPSSVSSDVEYTIRWAPTGGAIYDVEESQAESFATFTTVSTPGAEATFKHKNETANPATYYYRVRAIGTCAGQQSLFSPAISVTVLPQQGDANSLNGSTPSDNKQPVTSTIDLGGNGVASRGVIAAAAGDSFTAIPTEPWISVTPSSGIIPPSGIKLTVTSNTSALPLGTSTGGVVININGASAAGRRPLDNKSTTTTVSVTVSQPVANQSKNTPPPDALIIPAVAHADGINSHFQSDIRVTNTAATVTKYQLTFTPTGDTGISLGKQTTIDVEPGKTVALDDVLQNWFGAQSATGTLEVRPMNTTSSTNAAAQALGALPNFVSFASSRTFNSTANGTFGQYIPGIPFASFVGRGADAAKSTILSLQQIAQSAQYRTNLGIVEGSGEPAQVLVSIFGSNGSKLTEFTQDLKGGQHMQLNGVLATKGLTNVADGRIEVKVITATGKVTAYASVVDNATNDPLLVSPVSINQSLSSAKYVIPGVANLNTGFANWQTDVRLFNAAAVPVNATLTFVSQAGEAPIVKQLTIGSKEVKNLDSMLQSFFGLSGNAGGALHIATASPVPLVATARTYNLTSNGTYGQFIPAVTPNDAASRGSRALQLLQIEESNRYRTNLGLAEVTGSDAKVEITVIPPDTKVAAKTVVDLKANQFVQYSQVLRSMGLADTYNARMTVRVIDGNGRVAAYASVIDAQTNDPTYGPAQ